MYNNIKVIAILAAAGVGSRMGSDKPKQFIKIGGKTILESTALMFEKNQYVDEIIVVTNKDYIYDTKRILEGANLTKKHIIVEGGKERQDSIYNGIKEIKAIKEEALVLIHDAARPFAKQDLIDTIVREAWNVGAAVPVVNPKDTTRIIDADPTKSRTLNRESLRNVQTPQGFRLELLNRAYCKAKEDKYYGTDDSQLVENLGEKVALIPGDYSNIKITTKEDLKMEYKIGTGYDVHKFAKDRQLILGGVNIPYEKGLLGHSDADVLLHAIKDAILGAAGLGDIGKHFPDSDPQYKGISSLLLLKKVGEIIREDNYSIGNIDATVMAEKPKIAKYIEQMKNNIAEVLYIDVGRINIKGTTCEGLGFIGREEGIAAQAVCILNR